MSEVEKELKKELKKKNIQRAILNSISTVGILSVALLAPNALQVLKPFGLDRNFKSNTNRSLSRLISLGLVVFVEKDGKKYYLGLFDCIKDAATAYNLKAYELFGEYASFNE